MRKATLIAIASTVLSIAAAGCNNNPIAAHKLVTTGGEHTVPLYPDEATFLKISHNAQQGGVTGMVGSAQQGLTAKKIEDQTPVKVISSDTVGSQVEIVEGPMKGTAGFVANQNVD